MSHKGLPPLCNAACGVPSAGCIQPWCISSTLCLPVVHGTYDCNLAVDSIAAVVALQVVSQLDSPDMGNGSDGLGTPPHSHAQAAELQLAAAWQVACCSGPATVTSTPQACMPCNASAPHLH